jgi:hypothetical protein
LPVIAAQVIIAGAIPRFHPPRLRLALYFYLIYDGILLSSAIIAEGLKRNTKCRRAFHQQLANYRQSQKVLRDRIRESRQKTTTCNNGVTIQKMNSLQKPNTSEADTLANRYTRYGFRFLPLVQ